VAHRHLLPAYLIQSRRFEIYLHSNSASHYRSSQQPPREPEILTKIVVLPQLRWLIKSLSPRKPGFDAWLFQMGFMVGESKARTGVSPSTSVFPCYYHSTTALHSFLYPLRRYTLKQTFWNPVTVQGGSVHCAVQTGALIVTEVNFSLWKVN
jgi:hypothetical protein